MDSFTGIKSLDDFVILIKENENILAIYETGSYLEGFSDEFSDRDFHIIWSSAIPNVNKRIKAAKKLGFDIHDMRDVLSIGKGFDLFSDGNNLFNIASGTGDNEIRWYETLLADKLPNDLEEILMAISAFDNTKIYFQKDNWIDKLKAKTILTNEIRKKILDKYVVQTATDLKLLEKSDKRNDILQFLKYIERVLRSFQIVYLVGNNKPVVSPKFFEKRFAKIENSQITKLIREISHGFNMNEIYEKTLEVAGILGIKQSEKQTA